MTTFVTESNINTSTFTQVETIGLASLQAAIALWNQFRSQNPTLPPFEEILADADKIADKIIDTAEKEIADAKTRLNP